MLPLDDHRWSTLSHAYGPAHDIPDLLRCLAEQPGPKSDFREEPWFSLWSALCHQGDVYDASYAAVPHVTAIAATATGSLAPDFFVLPASIEVARSTGRGPAVPADLQADYAASLGQLAQCVARHARASWDQDMLISALAALAVAKGHPRVAGALLTLDDDLIERILDLEFDR